MDPSNDKTKTDNKQIVDYLKFYIEMKNSPDYAVFLNGPWGSGKTWFIKKFCKENTNHKFIYVSLYGVQSVSEIEDQVFQQLHPILASKPFSIGAKILKGTLKATLKIDLDGDKHDDIQFNGQIPDLDVRKFISDSENRIIIFDDLERCPKLEILLGYINHFVEHQGQKVILIGHESEISGLEEYQRKNEKLIGRRFTISTEIKNALSDFVESIQDREAKTALSENSSRILEIYKRSDYGNLRILRYGVLEYERFFLQLPKKARTHSEFQSDCINSFFSLAMELRSGKIKPGDIKNLALMYRSYIAKQALNKKEQTELDPIAAIYQKHFNSSSQIISPNEESLYFFFEYGTMPSDVIEEAVDSNRFFFRDATPAWVKLWHVFSLTDDEFKVYFDEVLKDFKDRKFKAQGELRHVFGILISLARNGIINSTYTEVVRLIDNVIVEMIAKNEIELLPFKGESVPRFDDSYGGLAFFEYKDEAFKKFSESLKKYQADKYEESIKASAEDLIPLMKSDSRIFLNQLVHSSREKENFYDVPILNHIEPSKFVKALVEMNPKSNARFNIGYVFKERYNLVGHYKKLMEELNWLKNVDSEIGTILSSLEQPTKYHLEHLRSTFLAPAISKLEEIQKRDETTSLPG